MNDTPGLQFRPPPAALLPSLQAAIADAVATLEPHQHVALVSIATETGANAALVARLPAGWEVQTWIGKTWSGPVQYGAIVRKAW